MAGRMVDSYPRRVMRRLRASSVASTMSCPVALTGGGGGVGGGSFSGLENPMRPMKHRAGGSAIWKTLADSEFHMVSVVRGTI